MSEIGLFIIGFTVTLVIFCAADVILRCCKASK